MKKIISLVLCIIMIAALAACGTDSKGAEEKSTVESSVSGSSVSENNVEKKDPTPITFTLFCNVNRPYVDLNEETPVVKKVKELTGVSIEWQFPVGGDYIEKISLMAATNDYPDFIAASDATPILYEAGAIIKLDELIDKYGSNIKNMYSPEILKRCRWNLSDKAIYYFPQGLDDGVPTTEVKNGYMLQLAALKEAGYPKIKTLSDYEDVIKMYKDKYPTIDGKPTIGFTLCFDGWHSTFSAQNPPAHAAGFSYYNDDWEYVIDVNTHKSTFRYRTPEYKEAYRWLNHMNAIGLIDSESFVQKFDQYLAKIAQGRVIGFSDNISWHTVQAIDSLKAAEDYDRLYAVLGPTINEDVRFGAHNMGCIAPTYGLTISKSCKDPVRAVQFIDWLCTDEAQILNNWGIEGVNYTIENGKRVIPDDEWKTRLNDSATYFKKTGIANFLDPFPKRIYRSKDPSGQYYQPDDTQVQLDSQFDPEKEALKAYGVQFWSELFPDPNTIPETPWGPGWVINFSTDSKAETIHRTCQDIVNKSLVKAILAKPSDFDSVWQQFMSELEAADVIEMEKQFDILINRKVRLFTED